MKISMTEREIPLSQEQYIDTILKRIRLSDCRSVSTPIDPKCQLTHANDSDPVYEQNLYQQMIGSLMYLVTCTRPDLAFTVSFLSQSLAHPTPIYHTAVKRVFRYLQGTKTNRLSYPRNGSVTLTGYSDASYAYCITTRRSYSGHVFYLGDCQISWMSRKQQSVATSTTEAEYMALSLAARQASWYEQGFKQFKLSIPISLNCDNQSGIKLAENPVLHQRYKSWKIPSRRMMKQSATVATMRQEGP
jgi:hypothetical protein